MKKYEKPVIIPKLVNREDVLTASPCEFVKDVGDFWNEEFN